MVSVKRLAAGSWARAIVDENEDDDDDANVRGPMRRAEIASRRHIEVFAVELPADFCVWAGSERCKEPQKEND